MANFQSPKQSLLNTQNREGNTVLHEAALNDDDFLVKKILSLRLVDEQIENKEGLTALQISNDLNAQKFKEDFEKKRIKEERALERRRKQRERREQDRTEHKGEEPEEEDYAPEERISKEKRSKKKVAEEREAAQKKAVFMFIVLLLVFFVGLYFLLEAVIRTRTDTW